MKRKLIVGTRGSKLALAQAQLVVDALKVALGKIDWTATSGAAIAIETKIIATKGDTNQSPIPLDTVGKAWFTAEIEQALIAGEIDLAVHSLKDVPPETASGAAHNSVSSGLVIVPVLERADPRDVLISKSGGGISDRGPLLKDLPRGAVVGTDSIRRKILLLDARPDLVVKSIRGNVDTRLKKLHGENAEGALASGTEKYDAIVLAAAGLERVGMLDVVAEFFEPTIFSIAPGQGILAAEARAGDAEILALLRGLEHVPTRIAAVAELAFTRAIGGGCKLPIGCYARIEGDVARGGTIMIHGMMGDENGKQVMRKSITGPVEQATALAENLAREFEP